MTHTTTSPTPAGATSPAIEITMRCRAFSGERKPAAHRLLITSLRPCDGDVMVWDSIAGHYTRHHILGGHSRGVARGIAAKIGGAL